MAEAVENLLDALRLPVTLELLTSYSQSTVVV